jgi:hypothetical protein
MLQQVLVVVELLLIQIDYNGLQLCLEILYVYSSCRKVTTTTLASNSTGRGYSSSRGGLFTLR